MSAHIELAKAIIRSTEAQTVSDEGIAYLVYTLGDVSVTLNDETKKLVGMNLTVGPLEVTYTEGDFVILEDDEASKITSEKLLQKINEHIEWRRGLLTEFSI